LESRNYEMRVLFRKKKTKSHGDTEHNYRGGYDNSNCSNDINEIMYQQQKKRTTAY